MNATPRFYLPIYLQYFDRELAAAADFRPSAELVKATTQALLIGTPVHLYCNVSTTWQCPASDPDIVRFLSQLIQFGHLHLLSHHKTLSEFLEAQRAAYGHDRLRYPMYFDAGFEHLVELEPTQFKASSATTQVQYGLHRWAIDHERDGEAGLIEANVEKETKNAVAQILTRRSQEAVTFTLFNSHLAKGLLDNPAVVGALRRIISQIYTTHYLEDAGGDLPTGIQGLHYFDSLGRSFPLYDVPILRCLVRWLDLDCIGQRPDLWEELLAIRGEQSHRLYCDMLRIFLAGVVTYCDFDLPLKPSVWVRGRLLEAVDRLLRQNAYRTASARSAVNRFLRAAHVLHRVVERGYEDPKFLRGALAMKDALKLNRPLVMIAVATEIERDMVLAEACGKSTKVVPHRYKGDHTYFELGLHGGCEVVLVKTGMGTGGPSGSQETLSDAVKDLKPTAVIMVGIAFGLRQDKQRIGDILVSAQLECYEKQRLGEGPAGEPVRIVRGARAAATPRLIDRCDAGTVGWNQARVHFGLVMSGDKLVDCPTFRQQLLDLEPEAIGGEMEGAGLYVAAYKGKVDWIVVKAIADWGQYKNVPEKDANQAVAANNATQFVLRVIRQGGLSEGVRT